MKKLLLLCVAVLLVPLTASAVPLQIPYSGQLSESGSLVAGTPTRSPDVQAHSYFARAYALEKNNKTDEAIALYTKAIDLAEPEASRVPPTTLALYFERRAICHLHAHRIGVAALDYHKACCLDRRLQTPILAFLPSSQVMVSIERSRVSKAHCVADTLTCLSWGLIDGALGFLADCPVYREDVKRPGRALYRFPNSRVPLRMVPLPKFVRGRNMLVPSFALFPQPQQKRIVSGYETSAEISVIQTTGGPGGIAFSEVGVGLTMVFSAADLVKPGAAVVAQFRQIPGKGYRMEMSVIDKDLIDALVERRKERAWKQQ